MIKTEISSLAYGGRGIARVDGKVCFVEGAVPGDVVEIEFTGTFPKYTTARIKRIIEGSPHRAEPVCPYYGSCGGCQLQHISYSEELFQKKEQVRELFRRIGDIDISENLEDMESSENEYGYRSSVTLHKTDGSGGYGFFASSSRRMIEIRSCSIAVPSIGENIGEHVAGSTKKDITLKADHAGNVWTSGRSGHRFFLDKWSGKDMFFSPGAFSQCNRRIAEKISDVLSNWISGGRHDGAFFDLYAGMGFFSFAVKGDFVSRTGVDISRVSIDCAKQTAKTYGIERTYFYRQDAETFFDGIFISKKERSNIIFVDPPRSGIDKSLLSKMRDSSDVGSLYYLSCDPASMSRDIKILTHAGKLELKRIKPFDMFPRTGHIEVLAELVRV